jgi:hypothetical protein
MIKRHLIIVSIFTAVLIILLIILMVGQGSSYEPAEAEVSYSPVYIGQAI